MAVINAGLRSFALDLQAAEKPVVHYQWAPVAGGNKTGSFIRTFAIRVPMFTSVAQANAAVIEQIRRAPHWLDVATSSLVNQLNSMKGKTLLHAGPPMRWQEMTGPMKGACIGACLFEGDGQ